MNQSITITITDYGTPTIARHAFLFMKVNGMVITCDAIPMSKAYKLMLILGRMGYHPKMEQNRYDKSIMTYETFAMFRR